MMEWKPIKDLLPEHGEVLIFAPDETPQIVSGSLVPCFGDSVEYYVRYTEELLHDSVGEILNPTAFCKITTPTGDKP